MGDFCQNPDFPILLGFLSAIFDVIFSLFQIAHFGPKFCHENPLVIFVAVNPVLRVPRLEERALTFIAGFSIFDLVQGTTKTERIEVVGRESHRVLFRTVPGEACPDRLIKWLDPLSRTSRTPPNKNSEIRPKVPY